jgi:hypothetical protein
MYRRAALAALLASASIVMFAQGMGAPMGGMGGPPPDGMHPGMHRPDPARMQQVMAKHQAALKAKLKITPEQEGAWSTFTASMQPPTHMAMRPDPAEMQKLTTPERIDKMRALRGEHQAEMDKRADAVKVFYATLAPEQKKVFDAEQLRHPRERGGMRGPKDGMMGGNSSPTK